MEDCNTCEVTINQPLSCNETILFLYENIPSYDSWTGNKNVSVRDILSLFRLLRINKELWEDYYQRLLFFHTEFIDERHKLTDKEAKREETKRKAQNLANKKSSGRKKR